jgi:hypothetical protein
MKLMKMGGREEILLERETIISIVLELLLASIAKPYLSIYGVDCICR